MSKTLKLVLFSFLTFFLIQGAGAFEIPNKFLSIGSPIFIENFDEEKYYAVFLPFSEPTNGDVCSNMSGKELAEDNDLRNYGTCFINDEGTFTVVEIEEPFSSSYTSLLENDGILQEQKVTMIALDTGESDEGVVTDLDQFIQSAETEIDRILGNLTGTSESTESTSSEESILGSRNIDMLALIKGNLLLFSLLVLNLVTLIILIFVISKKWDGPNSKKQ
jgi:hypothetical protein